MRIARFSLAALFIALTGCAPEPQRAAPNRTLASAAQYEEYRARWEAEKEREEIEAEATRKEIDALRQEVESLKKERRPGSYQSSDEYLAHLRSLRDARKTQPVTPSATPAPIPQAPKPDPNAKAIDAEVSKILGGEHGKLPPAQQIRGDSSGIAAIQIKNRTSYTLTVLYSGKTSQKAVITANGTASVSLAAGAYTVAASVDTPRVLPFAGTDNLSGGSYSNEFYIRTSTR